MAGELRRVNHFPHVRFDEGVRMLFNPILKRRYMPRPEERVRLTLLERLLHEEGWSRNRLGFEVPLQAAHTRTALRADLVLYDEAMEPQVLIECKSPSERLNRSVAEQIARYNRALQVPWLMISNGHQELCFRVTDEGVDSATSAHMLSSIRSSKESVRVDVSASSAYSASPADTTQYWIDRGFLAPESVGPGATVRSTADATSQSTADANSQSTADATAQSIGQSTPNIATRVARWLSAEFHRSKQPVRPLQPHTPFLAYPADHYYRIETLSPHQKAAWTVLNTFQGDTRLIALFTLHNQPVGAVEAILYFDKTGVEQDAKSVGTASPINPKQTFLYSYNADGIAAMTSMEDQSRQMSEATATASQMAPAEAPAILHTSEDLITFHRDALMWFGDYFADASTRNET